MGIGAMSGFSTAWNDQRKKAIDLQRDELDLKQQTFEFQQKQQEFNESQQILAMQAGTLQGMGSDQSSGQQQMPPPTQPQPPSPPQQMAPPPGGGGQPPMPAQQQMGPPQGGPQPQQMRPGQPPPTQGGMPQQQMPPRPPMGPPQGGQMQAPTQPQQMGPPQGSTPRPPQGMGPQSGQMGQPTSPMGQGQYSLPQLMQLLQQKNPGAAPAVQLKAAAGLLQMLRPNDQMAVKMGLEMQKQQSQMQIEMMKEQAQQQMQSQRDMFMMQLNSIREHSQDSRTDAAIDAATKRTEMMINAQDMRTDKVQAAESDRQQKRLDAERAASGARPLSATEQKRKDQAAEVQDVIRLGDSITGRIDKAYGTVGVSGMAGRAAETVGGLFGGDQERRELNTDVQQFAQSYGRLMGARGGHLTAADRADLQTLIGASHPGSNPKLAKSQINQAMSRLVGKYKNELESYGDDGSDQASSAAPADQSGGWSITPVK